MVHVEHLSFFYGKRPVLSDINLDLEAGRIYGLLGENGAGKTTLLNLLCGLKKPSSGSIRTSLGQKPWQRRPSFLEQVIFLPDELPFYSGTALDFERDYAPLRKHFDSEGYRALLKSFGIDPSQRMDRLSYGQLKKVHIAFALNSGAGLILMDEPVNGLDIPSKIQFRKALQSYGGEKKCVVISTHQLADVTDIIDSFINL